MQGDSLIVRHEPVSRACIAYKTKKRSGFSRVDGIRTEVNVVTEHVNDTLSSSPTYSITKKKIFGKAEIDAGGDGELGVD